MIYAQIHTYNGTEQTIAARFDQPDSTWTAYDVPSADWLSMVNGAIVVATVDPAIAITQASQIASLYQSYTSAIQTPVSYTSKGGITKTYQADAVSQSTLAKELAVYSITGATPAGYYWVAADNTQVPFTLADLQGLTQATGAQGWAEFQHLQTQKTAVNDIANLPQRLANTPYASGAEIVDGNGNVWSCTTQGTTGTTCTFPSSPTAGTTKTDGGVTWAYENAQVAMIQSIVW